MATQSKIVAGRKIVWDDGLFDYTQAGEFSTGVNLEISRIKKEVTRGHQSKYLSDLKQLTDKNIKHWKEQLTNKKSEAQQHIDLLKQQASRIRKKDRNLTADEVSILTYHTNILKSKIALLSSDIEFQAFTKELLEAPEQVRQAFIDNAPSILSNYKGDKDESKISNFETKNIMNSIEKSLLSQEELEAENELNSKIKEFEQIKNGAVVSEISLNHTINGLNSKLSWELVLEESGDENNEEY
ncbi:hypothetical protein [Cytobacillus praedii]|uniref:hypothetical protein n=1 Tax=Cytobacillus praedii TaxID=1742358 RepID=UPI002E21AA74|nr:hypothetical protein [Cytobacillus praedii]